MERICINVKRVVKTIPLRAVSTSIRKAFIKASGIYVTTVIRVLLASATCDFMRKAHMKASSTRVRNVTNPS